MCGIAGYINFGTDRIPDATIGAMTDAIHHRGPDSFGAWRDQECGVAMGHRRLSIVDLSPAGNQPMVSHCERYVLAFNGEIYNHSELRARLEVENNDINWRGHSDTEVWLTAISRWGLAEALNAANGMFAIALWDRQTRTLSLACDRMGEKPLYYGWMGSHFLFGSELKSLMAHPAWNPVIDRNAFSLYIRHNYVPAPHSIFQGVRKLEPATIATIHWSNVRGNRDWPDLYKFWSAYATVERAAVCRSAMSDSETDGEFERLLRSSVELRMQADVPLGAFLSGGFDSTAVVAMMQTLSSRPVRTFTIGFSERTYDEAPAARKIAKHLGTDHSEVYVSPEETMDIIPRLPMLYDEPFADNSQIPTFLVAQLARNNVKVALSGDGGDELLGGYRHYLYANRINEVASNFPNIVRRGLAGSIRAASKARRHWSGQHTGIDEIAAIANRFDKIAAVVAGETLPVRRDVFTKGSMGQVEAELSMPAPAGLGVVERMMYQDFTRYLPGDILVKLDRATMGVSLEGRVPFLDHRLVEFAWNLPLRKKISGRVGKQILRNLVFRHVPSSLMARPKSGFAVPIGTWLRGPLRPWVESHISPARIAKEGYLDPNAVDQVWKAHLSGKVDHHSVLWAVLMFQCWLEKFTEKASFQVSDSRAAVGQEQ